MTPALLQREAVLAAVAVLAVVVALAVVGLTQAGDDASAGSDEVTATPAGSWYSAFAAPYAFEQGARRTRCGIRIGPRTFGVAHPVLPCGAKIVLEFDGTRVLTQVIDRGPSAPGREFGISRPLAKRLQLAGVQRLRWQFAR